MAARHITKRLVDALQPNQTVWDTEVQGFGVRRQHGRPTYVLKYRLRNRQRWWTIGVHGSPWTPDLARRRARELLGRVAAGEDLAVALGRADAMMTIAELCDRYLEAGCAEKKASTLATDRGRIQRHIKPLLGSLPVRAVSQADIEKFKKDVADGQTAIDVRTGPRGRARVRGGKGTATRTLGLLGAIFTYAIKLKLRDDNPVTGIRRYRGRRVDTVLTQEQLCRLAATLAVTQSRAHNPYAVGAILILCLTGLRKSEVLKLQWPDLEPEWNALHLRDSKTGGRRVPVHPAVFEVLEVLPKRSNCKWVFPAATGPGHFVGLPKVWRKLCGEAGIGHVRLHDLRHTFASRAAGQNIGLPVIGNLLGHRDPTTTARYATVQSEPIRWALERTAGPLAELLVPNAKNRLPVALDAPTAALLEAAE